MIIYKLKCKKEEIPPRKKLTGAEAHGACGELQSTALCLTRN